ncbi:MAG: GNAT family N-acetyltransferase [Pelagibaca sp.]
MTDLVLRDLASLAEMKASEAFQRSVWGADDPPDNSDMLLAIQHEGGLVAGAFDNDRMVAFLFGFPTSDPAAQHSHRLGVHPDWQGQGLGLRMKLYQKDWCLARGITCVRWTYDPARRANAVLNIHRLGATARTYYRDYYGVMEGINAGVPSDRLLAEWDLTRPVDAKVTPTGTVPIPADFAKLTADDPGDALSERLRIRVALESAFADGFQIAGFDRTQNAYLLARA